MIVSTSVSRLRVVDFCKTIEVESSKSLPSTATTARLDESHASVAISAAACIGSVGTKYSTEDLPSEARYVFQSSNK